MNKKFKNSNNAVTWIGVGTAIGAAVFAATKEPVWIAVGVAIGAALSRQKPKIKMRNKSRHLYTHRDGRVRFSTPKVF